MPKPRIRKQPQRTDFGTFVLHWTAAGALLTSLATGLTIAADAPARSWLAPIRGLLPQGEIWRIHLIAGVVLAAVVAAHVVYLRQARLTRRIALDRARIAALRLRGRPRWAAINVVLSWVLLALLAIQIVTGALLYLGHGGAVARIHAIAAWTLLAYPIAHVLAHYAYGRIQHLLRILRPGPLIAGPPPATLADLVHAHLARNSATRAPRQNDRGGRTLSAHPLAVAGAAALTVAAMIASLDRGARDTLSVPRIARAQAPLLDGDISDAVWRKATAVTVATNQGANFAGTGATRISIRALHDGEIAYFAFTWDDPSRSLKHLPLIKRADGWHVLHTRYDVEDEDSYYEDKFSVMLAASARMPAAGSIHIGPRPLSDKPAPMSGRGLHFTDDGSVVDVWHWKAARGGLLGWMDDNHFSAPTQPTPAELKGAVRYKAGYKTDAGKAFYANNFDAEPPGGYGSPVTPKRLPKDLVATAAAMGPIDLDPDTSETAGARWWMTEAETEPYSAVADQVIPVGTVIPGVLIQGEYSGDRADVRAAAQWSAGRWTLEVARRLDTGSKDDIAIRSGTALWVAAFDHSQTRHTRHMRPITMEVAP